MFSAEEGASRTQILSSQDWGQGDILPCPGLESESGIFQLMEGRVGERGGKGRRKEMEGSKAELEAKIQMRIRGWGWRDGERI